MRKKQEWKKMWFTDNLEPVTPTSPTWVTQLHLRTSRQPPILNRICKYCGRKVTEATTKCRGCGVEEKKDGDFKLVMQV